MMNPFNDYFLDRLRNLRQDSTVDVFYSRFELLMTFVLNTFPWIWERYFVSTFILGLKHEIQIYVLQHHPVTLLDALELASIQEYSLRAAARTTEKLAQEHEASCIPIDSAQGAHDGCPCEFASTDILEDRSRGMGFCASSGPHIVVAVSEGDENSVDQNAAELTIATQVEVIADSPVYNTGHATRLTVLAEVEQSNCSTAVSSTLSVLQLGGHYNIMDKGGTPELCQELILFNGFVSGKIIWDKDVTIPQLKQRWPPPLQDAILLCPVIESNAMVLLSCKLLQYQFYALNFLQYKACYSVYVLQYFLTLLSQPSYVFLHLQYRWYCLRITHTNQSASGSYAGAAQVLWGPDARS